MLKDNIDEYSLTDALESMKLLESLEKSQGLSEDLKKSKKKLEERITFLKSCHLDIIKNKVKKEKL